MRGLVVVDGSAPVGLFTQLEAIRGRALPPELRQRPVEEIMSYETMPLDTNSAFIRSVTNRRFGAPPSTFMMAQLTSSMLEIVHGARTGGVQGYGDVIGKSKD